MQGFQFAGGSMIGRDHRMITKNNQDSWTILEDDDITVAIVADGCGSGKHSEIGAKIATQMMSVILRDHYRHCKAVSINLAALSGVQAMRNIAHYIEGNMWADTRQVVEDYLLFTLVGAVLTDQEATFFARGDGLIVVNGEHTQLGPFPGNMPPYLGYDLIDEMQVAGLQGPGLTYERQMPIDQLDSFLIATDGITDLVDHKDTMMPGLDRPVGGLDQFWQNDRYFGGNPELVTRQLKLIGRDWPHSNPEPGLLRDDTTLIVGRRKEEGREGHLPERQSSAAEA